MLTPHQKKAVELDDHLALTANAGSGKTFVLSRKYLEAAIKLGGNVSAIAAITFTEKAASELYNKISKLIDEEISTTTDENRINILAKVRRNLVSAYISTIHSFCIDIIREFPVETGIDANFIPIDQALSNELIEISVEETIDNTFNDPKTSEIVKQLLRYFGKRSSLQNEIIHLIEKRKNVLKVRNEIYSKSDEEIANHFQNGFIENFSFIWNYYEADFIDAINKINNTVLTEIPKNENAPVIRNIINHYLSNREAIKLLSGLGNILFTNDGKVRTQKYLGRNLKETLSKEISVAEKIFADFSVFTEEMNHNSYYDLAQFGRNVLMLFDKSLELYQKKKRDESYIDFEDILIYTKELLSNSEVQQYLKNKFKYLMVDEFQDTNEIQYEIFLPVLDYLKAGKLFIVGDEKQSIYKFRDAEIEIFNRTKSDIERIKDKSHLMVLPDSFRMSKEICLFTNVLFNRLFEKDIPAFGELKNVPIVCAKQEESKGEVQFLISVKESSEQTQAELVANKILQLVDSENFKFNDITVLVRKRKSFDDLEKIFIRYKIPYTIIGGRGFYQRQVINDIYNYLAFLLNQDNDTALIGILRSPFFNIPDTTLFEISIQDGNSFYSKLNSFVKDERLESIKTLLKLHIDLSASLQITQLISRILSDTQFLSIVRNRIDGEQEIANIEKLLAVSRNFDGKGYRNLYDFVHFLKDSIEKEEDEPQAAVSMKTDAVQMMTIHQAKGLEFPVVFLYKCDEYGQRGRTKSKSISVSKNFGLLAKLPDKENPTGKYQATPITVLYDFVEKKKNLAEIKRLLYVAVTRAKERLYITGEIKKGKFPVTESFLFLLRDGLNIDFENNFEIEDELSFLKKINNEFIEEKKQLRLNISVLDKLIYESKKSEKTLQQFPGRKYLLQEMPLIEKSQIISATRVAVYSQCPLKYHLTYNLGFALLNKLLPDWRKTEYQFYPEFDENNLTESLTENEAEFPNTFGLSNIYSEKFGEIIHKILELELAEDEITDFLLKRINQLNLNDNESRKIFDEILQIIITYRNSKIFKQIAGYKNYRNEFEIYVKENFYFLHGIIDKIIFEKDKILIIDYKTDVIDEKSVSQKFKEYSNQLKFYVYISKQLFKDCENFEALLVFLRMPETDFRLIFSDRNLGELQKEISSYIEGIINSRFHKNEEHCKYCQFSLNEDCVVN